MSISRKQFLLQASAISIGFSGFKVLNTLLNRQNVDLQALTEPHGLRQRGFEAGATRFARGEGMWYGKNGVYFACTNGGLNKKGQIWKYVPSSYEATAKEHDKPGRLELFIEPDDGNIIENVDNLTVAPLGRFNCL